LEGQLDVTLREVREEIAAGVQDAPEATFAEFADRWYNDYAKPNVRAKTARDYEAIIRVHLVPAFGEQMLSEIQPADVQAFVAEKSRSGLSAGTVNKQLVILKAMLARAVEWRYLRESPARYVKRLREPQREMDYFRPDEINSFLEAASVSNRLLFATAIFTGLRQGELLALRWGDIDLLKGVLYVRRTYHPAFGFGEPKSAAGRRAVYLPPDLMEMFREEGFARRPEDLVFTNREGRPFDPSGLVRHEFHPTLSRAGLRRIRFHDLRHTYAAMMISVGASPKLLQEQMGHESISTTMRHYGHLMPSVSEGVGAKLEALVYDSNVPPFRGSRRE
jgi:integrase